jgi:hypothetical protein
MRLGDKHSADEWKELYAELVRWELELSKGQDQGMTDILRSQWAEANELFSRFVERTTMWIG